MKDKNLNAKDFKKPGNQYRMAPFWFLNDYLKPSEMRRQVREFAKKNVGGAIMHGRFGLRTPYFSKDWWKCIGAAVDEGEKVIFLLCNDESVKLYNHNYALSGKGDGVIGFAGSDAQGVRLFLGLTLEQLEKLTQNPICKSRLYTTDGYIEYDHKETDSKIVQENFLEFYNYITNK